jgi:hypothetical protein
MHFVRGRRHDAFRQQWPDSQAGAMLGARLVTAKVYSHSNVYSHSKIQGERRTSK